MSDPQPTPKPAKASPAPIPGEDDGSLESKMDRVAVAIADRIINGEAVDGETIGAFKALTAYFAATKKPSKSKGEDEPDDGPKGNFDDFRSAVASASSHDRGNGHV